MPRKRTPNKLKVLKGTDRPDRMRVEPEFEAVTEYPDPPTELVNGHARDEWHQKSRALVDAGILKGTELSALATYCNTYGRIQEAFEDGGMPSGSHLTQLRMMWNEFGLTPASRTKVTGGVDADDDNPFRELAG